MKDAKICRNILLIFMKPSETMVNEMEKNSTKKAPLKRSFPKKCRDYSL